MPANLTPQYLKAEEAYKHAQSFEDKLAGLEEMLRLIPKHKGTERIQGEIKHKMSMLKKEQSSPKKGGGGKKPSHSVDSNGFPQVVVIGPPNSGRSRLINELTGAELKVADYPFTTRVPQPAMMPFENVKIQLVDMPAIAPNFMESWVPGIVRSGDMAILVVDLGSDEILESVETVIASLQSQRVYLNAKEGEELIGDAIRKTLLVANKKDLPNAMDIFGLLQDSYGKKFECMAVSAVSKEGLEDLKRRIFEMLEIIRIYAKPPGKKPNMADPIIMPRGAIVTELADHIHHELAKTLKSAKVWGDKNYTDGQRVPLDYELQDGIIIELET